ncbi:hypothetical protein A9R12_14230, partial [Aeromonas hydrophila]
MDATPDLTLIRPILNFELRLRTLGAVLGTALLTVLHARGIQCTTNGVVTDTRQILHTTATDQNNRVFLKVVTFTADVGRDFEAVGQANTADLTECGVRLLRGSGVYASTHATLLRACLQRRDVTLGRLTLARLAHELVYGCHLLAPMGCTAFQQSDRMHLPYS